MDRSPKGAANARRSVAARALLGGVLLFWLATPLHAAKTRSELVFEINAALLAHDRAALARCFNFAGADEETRRSFGRILDEVFAWPTHHVFATDRTGADDPPIEQNGRRYRLNGDWRFQVHVFLSKKTKRGYVFPAGDVNGRTLVLLAVPEKP